MGALNNQLLLPQPTFAQSPTNPKESGNFKYPHLSGCSQNSNKLWVHGHSSPRGHNIFCKTKPGGRCGPCLLSASYHYSSAQQQHDSTNTLLTKLAAVQLLDALNMDACQSSLTALASGHCTGWYFEGCRRLAFSPLWA